MSSPSAGSNAPDICHAMPPWVLVRPTRLVSNAKMYFIGLGNRKGERRKTVTFQDKWRKTFTQFGVTLPLTPHGFSAFTRPQFAVGIAGAASG